MENELIARHGDRVGAVAAHAANSPKALVMKTRRGFFGWTWLVAFWGFQALMVMLVFASFQAADAGYTANAANDYQVAADIGTTLGLGIVAVAGWFVWFLGTFIFGVLALVTRGKTIIQAEGLVRS